MYNRQKRVEEDKEKKNILETKYRVQKRKTQDMIKDAITAHERKITKDIRNHKGHKKLWDVVNTLRGKKRHTDDKEEYIYDDQHNKIEPNQPSKEITKFWRQIYQKHENKISLEWNTEKREEYIQTFYDIEAIAQFQDEKAHISTILQEHFDSVGRVSITGYMEEPEITVQDVKQQIKRIKEKKYPGPDGMKPDILKILGTDDQCTQVMTCALNKIIKQEEMSPNSWALSKTVMVPKKKKPTIRDLRPIALTNATYKLFMGILKTKVEHHIRQIQQESEVQAGFTKNRRLADNLYILDYCIKESFKKKKPLYVIAIDFSKAFDSIKRDTLIQVLKKYSIHPKIIDIIAHIYEKDKTQVYFNNTHQADIDVTSGIRQGCNGSSNLFLLVTYLIIEKMYDCLNGVNTNICKIVALFFADDGIIMMQSLQEARESIKVLTGISQKCGLSINKRKSSILIYNNKDQPSHIEDIPVTSSFVYLGVTIQNKRDCYKLHRIECMNKAKKYSNLMPAVIARSCNKLLIGKTYWKSAALPSILHGTEVIFLSKKYITDLQVEENKALRYTVNARKATAISALQGEIGSSLQISRDMKSKIFYIKHILLHNNLPKEIFLHQFEEKQPSKWIKQIKIYMQDLNINLHAIEHYNPAKIKKLVKSWDDSLWRKDMHDKSTMSIYRKFNNNNIYLKSNIQCT